MRTESSLDILSGNHKIFMQSWLPDDQAAIARIILVHGIGEHSNRYRDAAEFFTPLSIEFHTFDQIGHGKSSGKRGAESYQQVFEIITKLINRLRNEQPEIPILLYGHSMGGAIVLAYGLNHPESICGIIASSPAIGLANPLPDRVIQILELMIRLFPDLTIQNRMNVQGLSQDPSIAEKYRSDPLVHNRVSLQLGVDIYKTGKRLLAQSAYPLPLLLLQGDKDILVDPSATNRFAAKIKGNVTYHQIKDGFHELHNESNKEEIFFTIRDWILETIKAEGEKLNILTNSE